MVRHYAKRISASVYQWCGLKLCWGKNKQKCQLKI